MNWRTQKLQWTQSSKQPKLNARGLAVLDECKAEGTVTPPENEVYELILKGALL